MLWILIALLLAGCSSSSPTGPVSTGDAGMDAGTDGGCNVPDAGAPDSGTPDAGDPGFALPAVPLSTQSRWIVDATGHRLKLTSVNWYGAESPDHVVAGLDRMSLSALARQIHDQGFNSVRLPWSNELYEQDPLVDSARLSANPDLQGLHALEVLDRVIAALAHEGLVVILDNHVSRADWCCSGTDGNGLWYTTDYPETSWIADWQGMARRYANQPAVIGADLRNELRSAPLPDGGTATATWGGSDPSVDWHAAAQRGGDAILSVAPQWLIFVEGVNYSNDFTGAYNLPVQLSVAGHLVYAPHDYSWDHPGLSSSQQLATDLGNAWGYLLTQGQPYTAPVWVGEFGTCHSSTSCVDDGAAGSQGLWFHAFADYLFNADIDWSYWAINGTQASGTGRTLGAEETYGVLDTTWSTPALPELSRALSALQPTWQGP